MPFSGCGMSSFRVGEGSTKRYRSRSPRFYIVPALLGYNRMPLFFLMIRFNDPFQDRGLLFWPMAPWHKELQVPMDQPQLQFDGAVAVSPFRSFPPLGTRTSEPTELSVVRMGSPKSSSRSVGMMISRTIPASTLLCLDSRVLHCEHNATYRSLIKACSASWRMVPQPHKLSPLS